MLPINSLAHSSSFRAQVAEKTKTEKKEIETRTKKEEKIEIKRKVGIRSGKMTVRAVPKYCDAFQ